MYVYTYVPNVNNITAGVVAAIEIKTSAESACLCGYNYI